jgi:electron transfer flavoprotein alpha subunit
LWLNTPAGAQRCHREGPDRSRRSRRRRPCPGRRQGRPGRGRRSREALTGAAKVLVAESDALEHQLAEPTADLIVGMAGDYDAIVAPATANGKNTLPRVAALLDVMQISDITAVVDADTFERPIYAGNAIQTVKSGDARR